MPPRRPARKSTFSTSERIKRDWKIHQHPEKMPDEIYWCYATDSDFQRMGWKTKRKGEKAYDRKTGTILEGMFPVFVKREELEAAGFTFKK